HFVALRARHQKLDLAKRKAEGLRFFNVFDGYQIAVRVGAISVQRLGGLMKDATTLVEADGFYANACLFGELADGAVFHGRSLSRTVEAVLGYGVKGEFTKHDGRLRGRGKEKGRRERLVLCGPDI